MRNWTKLFEDPREFHDEEKRVVKREYGFRKTTLLTGCLIAFILSMGHTDTKLYTETKEEEKNVQD